MCELSRRLEALREEAVQAISSAATPEALREAEVRYLGRKAELPQILRRLR